MVKITLVRFFLTGISEEQKLKSQKFVFRFTQKFKLHWKFVPCGVSLLNISTRTRNLSLVGFLWQILFSCRSMNISTRTLVVTAFYTKTPLTRCAMRRIHVNIGACLWRYFLPAVLLPRSGQLGVFVSEPGMYIIHCIPRLLFRNHSWTSVEMCPIMRWLLSPQSVVWAGWLSALNHLKPSPVSDRGSYSGFCL